MPNVSVVTWNMQRGAFGDGKSELEKKQIETRKEMLETLKNTYEIVLIQEAPKPLWNSVEDDQSSNPGWTIDRKEDNQDPSHACKCLVYFNGLAVVSRPHIEFRSGSQSAFRFPAACRTVIGTFPILVVSLHGTSGGGTINSGDGFDDITEALESGKKLKGDQPGLEPVRGLILGGDLNGAPGGGKLPGKPTNQGASIGSDGIDGFYTTGDYDIYNGGLVLESSNPPLRLVDDIDRVLVLTDGPKINNLAPGYHVKNATDGKLYRVSDHCPVETVVTITEKKKKK